MRISGKLLMGGLLAFTVVFTGALWYFQFHAFYEEYTTDSVEIAGRAMPVSDFRGIDASTSPLKLRACFRLEGEVEAPVAENPVPLVAPDWFECFDAREIATALEDGRATAWIAEDEEFDGADRIVARLDDGRAFMWRQLDERFAD